MPILVILPRREAGGFHPKPEGARVEVRGSAPMSYQAGQIIQLTTVDVAHGGWCVARPSDGPAVFVRHALPGETVLAPVTEVTSRLARAEAVQRLRPSPRRGEPPCPHRGPRRWRRWRRAPAAPPPP